MMTLVVMAAGMGSRFGGLKQIEPVGPNGEFIIDYSVFDAKRAGFDKVVFIIKESFADVFKDTIGKRLENQIEVEYAYQEFKDIPEGVELPSDREKPLGTGHALYCARNYIDGPFAVISADDFYGKEAFMDLASSLKNNGEYSVIGYEAKSTMSENGATKRGVIFVEDGYLSKIVESKVEEKDGKIHCEPLNGDEAYEVELNHPVSMLMYGLQKDAMKYVESDMEKFFATANLSKDEFLLPDVLETMVKDSIPFRTIQTKSVWKGVTYASDLQDLKDYIKGLVDSGYYPEKLYEENIQKTR